MGIVETSQNDGYSEFSSKLEKELFKTAQTIIPTATPFST